MSRRSAFAALLLLAGCARSEDASVVADSNLQAVERVRTPEQDDEEIALGAWRDTLQEEHAALEFGPNGTPPLFSLRCDARRSVFLQRHGAAPSGDLPMMLISIGSETRRLAVVSAGGTVPMLRASVPASDELLDTLADASEPIIARIGDAPPLVLPPNPAIRAFLERCASSATALPATEAGGNEAAAANESAPANAAAPAAPPPAQR